MNEHLISANDFCTYYKVEYEFINALQQHGLIEIIHIDNNDLIDTEQLGRLEKLARMHYEMDINVEGIQAIFHLLDRINEMDVELKRLKNKLGFYEEYRLNNENQ